MFSQQLRKIADEMDAIANTDEVFVCGTHGGQILVVRARSCGREHLVRAEFGYYLADASGLFAWVGDNEAGAPLPWAERFRALERKAALELAWIAKNKEVKS